MTMTFDTHAEIKKLMGAGVPEAQAEAIIGTVHMSAGFPDISHLATKSDLQAEIASAKLQMILAMFAVVGFANGIMFFALKN